MADGKLPVHSVGTVASGDFVGATGKLKFNFFYSTYSDCLLFFYYKLLLGGIGGRKQDKLHVSSGLGVILGVMRKIRKHETHRCRVTYSD